MPGISCMAKCQGTLPWASLVSRTIPMLLALLIGLRSEARESMIRKVIKPCLEGTLNEGALPSSFWAIYLFDCAF